MHTYINKEGIEESVPDNVIYCNFVSQFGNNIFQYIYACLLQQKNNGQIWIPSKSLMRTRPCHFVKTENKNICKIIDANIIDIPKWTGKNKGLCKVDEEGVDANPDLETYTFNNKPVLLTHYFQEYRFYRNHKNFIKQKLSKLFDIPAKNIPRENDVVIHMRGRDCGWPVAQKYFLRSLRYIKDFDNIHIVTDDPKRFGNFAETLKSSFSKDIFLWNQDSVEDFKFIMNAKKIVICGSTFSWWAAWLSEAEVICMPNTSLFRKLFVDEERYKVF